MSASTKKQLRKEQREANLTQRQLEAQAEAKRLKISTTIFVVLMAVVVVTAIAVMIITGVNRSGIIQKNTVAATVGEHKINSVELSYYYNDLISNEYNEWSQQYGENMNTYMQLMGLDLTKPLDEQLYVDGEGTWADHYISSAMDKAKSDYAMYDLAMSEGFELPEEDREMLESGESNMVMYAQLYGYPDIEDYLVAMYGFGANLETYREYSERNMIATAYYNAHMASLEYDEDAIRAHDKENYNNYSSFDFSTYYVSNSDYLTGGTTTDGTTVYSDEDHENARKAAKEVADELVTAENIVELDKKIAALDVNADDPNAGLTGYTDRLYTGISTFYNEWLADSARKDGDMTVAANETTETDAEGNETTTVNGYYVVVFQGRNDNTAPTVNVRHILAEFECTEEGEHEHTDFSDEEKKAAKEKAEELLKTWKDGEATEDSFGVLATKETDDTASASTGGLYEGLHAGAAYEPNFLDWAIDPERKVGDTGIVETSYGYHVMYFVGSGEQTYRDQLIVEHLRATDINAWYDGILEATSVTPGDTSHLNTSIVLGA